MRPHLGLVIGAIAGVIALIGLSAAGDVLQPTDILDAHWRAVVRIVTADQAGRTTAASGVVVDQGGIIATAFGLLRNAVAARVQLADGPVFDKVTLLVHDGSAALVAVDGKGFDRVKLDDPPRAAPTPQGTVSMNQSVVVVLGGPAGTGRIVTGTSNLLAGNWGSPVFTQEGKTVGIVAPVIWRVQPTAGAPIAPSHALRDLLSNALKLKTRPAPLASLPSAAAIPAHRTDKEIVTSAQTVQIVAPFADTQPQVTELQKRLSAGGTSLPWRVVNTVDDADLILVTTIQRISVMFPAETFADVKHDARTIEKYRAVASLRDKWSSRPLWSDREDVQGSAADAANQIATLVLKRLRDLAAGRSPGSQALAAAAPCAATSNISSPLSAWLVSVP